MSAWSDLEEHLKLRILDAREILRKAPRGFVAPELVAEAKETLRRAELAGLVEPEVKEATLENGPIVIEVGHLTLWAERGVGWLLVVDADAGSRWVRLTEEPTPGLGLGGSVLSRREVEALVKLHGRPT